MSLDPDIPASTLNVSDSWGLENVGSLGEGRCRCDGIEVTGTGES